MQTLLQLILKNFELVGYGCGLFLMAYVANIALGAWQSVKVNGFDFDWVLILNSLIKYIVMGLGIALLSIVVTVIPEYVTYIGIEIDPSLLEGVTNAVIIGAFLTATVRYAKDAIDKVINILGNS